jgi:hypothetical protein
MSCAQQLLSMARFSHATNDISVPQKCLPAGLDKGPSVVTLMLSAFPCTIYPSAVHMIHFSRRSLLNAVPR